GFWSDACPAPGMVMYQCEAAPAERSGTGHLVSSGRASKEFVMKCIDLIHLLDKKGTRNVTAVVRKERFDLAANLKHASLLHTSFVHEHHRIPGIAFDVTIVKYRT
ncbi:unnamed protein product, partial [Pylaiella littoralis]